VETTIAQKKLKKLIQAVTISIEVSYEFNDILMVQIKKYLTRIKETSYTDKIVHRIEIEQKDYARVADLLGEYQSRKRLTFSVEG
jgi:putative IMPACT (imprinted ancient) family translation regulator